MAKSLLGRMTGAVTRELVGGFAKQFGEPEPAVSKGMSAVFSALLGGAAARAEDPTFVSQLFALVTDSDNDPGLFDRPGQMLGADSSSPAMRLGGRLVSSVFGNKVDAVVAKIATVSGLPRVAVSMMLKFGGSMVLSMMRKKAKEDDLDEAGLAKLLREERGSYEAAMPAELGSIRSLLEAGNEPAELPSSQKEEGGSFWRWVIILLIAVAAIWFVLQIMNDPGDDIPPDEPQPMNSER
jgi:OOP family OmpA-OmpF porin